MRLPWSGAKSGVVRYQRSSDVTSVMQGGRVVLMDLKKAQFVSLDEVAVAIWELMAEPRSAGEISDQLSARYDAPPEVIRRDVDEFLDGLLADGLVTETRG